MVYQTRLCQLKSTDKESIKLNKRDIDVLNYNAGVCHKMPVFAIQFLQSMLLVKNRLFGVLLTLSQQSLQLEIDR